MTSRAKSGALADVRRDECTARPAAEPRSGSTGILTRLGLPTLWGKDVQGAWRVTRYSIVPIIEHVLVPGSFAYGSDMVPLTGGAVIAANHLSAVDPMLVGAFSHRTIWFMTKAELFRKRIVGEVFSFVGGFSVDRAGTDIGAMRVAHDLAAEGHLVGMFPEGTRQRLGYPANRVHGGALSIARRAHVPVIPCGIESFQWSLTNRRACCVVFGEPMFTEGFSSEREYRNAPSELHAEIVTLWREAATAVQQGFPPSTSGGLKRCDVPAPKDFHVVEAPRRATATFSSSRGVRH